MRCRRSRSIQNPQRLPEERGDGIVYASAELLRDGRHFIESVLDQVVLLLVTHQDRVPVRATMVMGEGRARRWVPKLRALHPMRGPDGDAKLLVPLAPRPRHPPVASRAVVYLLARGDKA